MIKPIIEFDYFGQNIYLLLAMVGVLFALLEIIKAFKLSQVDETSEMKLTLIFAFSAVIGLIMSNVTNWIFIDGLLELSFITRIQNAGFNFYGGILFFLLSSYVFLYLFKFDAKKWMNSIIPAILIFHAFGRVGCSLSGCCYGIELFDAPLIEHTHLELFPARELEAIFLFIMYFVFKNKIKENRLIYYFLFYGTFRFVNEFFRGDNRGSFIVPMLSPAQVISIVLVVSGIIYLILNFGKEKRVLVQ